MSNSLKLRLEVNSSSFKVNESACSLSIFFCDNGSASVQTLRRMGSLVHLSVSGIADEFVVRKAQLLTRLDTLYIDLERNTQLHRVGLTLRTIDLHELNRALKDFFDMSQSTYIYHP